MQDLCYLFKTVDQICIWHLQEQQNSGYREQEFSCTHIRTQKQSRGNKWEPYILRTILRKDNISSISFWVACVKIWLANFCSFDAEKLAAVKFRVCRQSIQRLNFGLYGYTQLLKCTESTVTVNSVQHIFSDSVARKHNYWNSVQTESHFETHST